jgi:hypothetical protein
MNADERGLVLLLGLAHAYAAPFINLELSTRAGVVNDLARGFDVDGM